MDLWIEKYRPQTLEELVSSKTNLEKFAQFIEEKSIPHMLFTGSAGLGKTTAAKILSSAISEEILYVNASDEASVDTIRVKVKEFCATISFSGDLKIVILDEFDGMSDHAMRMLRNTMEEFADSCRFILTCNYDTKVIDPIKSRCQIFEFSNTTPKDIAKRCLYILKEEGVKCVDCSCEIGRLVKAFYPDIRKVINNLQKFTINGKFEFIENFSADSDEKKSLLDLVKKADVKTIRKDLLGAGADYIGFYRYLFNNAKSISQSNAVDIMMDVSEHMYRHAIVPDQEINFVSCILRICVNRD